MLLLLPLLLFPPLQKETVFNKSLPKSRPPRCFSRGPSWPSFSCTREGHGSLSLLKKIQLPIFFSQNPVLVPYGSDIQF